MQAGNAVFFGHRPRVLREHRRVELAQEFISEVYVAAFLIRGVLPVAPAIVEVEHRAYRVDAYAVDVVLQRTGTPRIRGSSAPIDA
ncbi:MAG: hypothetical protein V8S87_00540 [Oscillospiraceae bacterium]